jgi:hypothetical protein
MKVKYVLMRERGVQRERSVIAHHRKTAFKAILEVLDTTDQGLHRSCKVARLYDEGRDKSISHTLLDVSIVWVNEGSMMLTGFERCKDANGNTVDYAQSWLCLLDLTEPKQVAPELTRPPRGHTTH